MAIDSDRLNHLLEQFVSDLGSTMHAPLVVLGDKLGLYRALAAADTALTPEELARRTDTDARYVREWLCSQAAGGYVTYDAASERFSLTPEQALALTDENGPAFLPGAFQVALAAIAGANKIEAAFRSGEGVGWHEHHPDLFVGTERFFRPGYAANLVSTWIPALDGVQAKLERGGTVADVGCGHGSSTVLMAQAYPKSRFFGFDYHPASIDVARQRARSAGVADRVQFEVATAREFPAGGYDLVTFFDCLHDMGDPVGAAAHVRQALAADGSWMIVEPYANDRIEDNLNPVGRSYYSASTLICTPASRAQEVGACLGAQAGEARLRSVAADGGFRQFRRVAETPFNLVFEAK